MALQDPFDKMLISTMTIKRRAAASSSANYGQPTSATPTTVASGVACRLSTMSGSRDYRYDKKTITNQFKVFCRPTDVQEHDFLEISGVRYRVRNVSNPATLNHHYEIMCEELTP